MSIFLLKIIAVFFMVVDHIKFALPQCFNEFTLYFGRISFPLFAFCLVQGYSHTSNFWKYLKRMAIAGIIAEVPFLLFNSLPLLNEIGLNIEFEFVLGLIALKSYDYFEKWWQKWGVVIVIGIIAILVRADYGIFGIFLIFSFYIFKENKWKTLLASLIVVAGKYLYRIFILGLGFSEYPIKNWYCTMIPLFIILFYNQKKGPSFKWFFYIFYPVHFIILYILSPYVTIG